jgi:hypothetical protein
MSRQYARDTVKLPVHEESVSAVTILDGHGRVLRVVPASEFRRGPAVRRQALASRRYGGRSAPGASPALVDAPEQSPKA